ncbi:MAG: Fic family protein [Thiolinea sp.]
MTQVEDRKESLALIEPMRLSERSRHRPKLTDMAMELATQSAGFRSSLPTGVNTALADLVRAMNCYYSNLIEGHDTHPVDIERALQNDYSRDPEKRTLQLEAKAHISVQQWIDSGSLQGRATTTTGIKEIHLQFCEQLPDALLWASNPEAGEHIAITPGQYRQHDVKVGRHTAISAGAIPRFLARFEQAYANLGKAETVIATAAAHHRLLWIHPFLDGNGRVARLLAYALLRETLETGGLWSVARGFARNEAAYKRHLANCDLPRRNDLDGRGHLSEEALAEFTHFFLETCIDQVQFMDKLVQPALLHKRILQWAKDEIAAGRLSPKAERILEALLYRGILARSEIPDILNTGDRQARRIVASLTKQGVIDSESTRAPLQLVFPARLASEWMPGLFPEKSE